LEGEYTKDFVPLVDIDEAFQLDLSLNILKRLWVLSVGTLNVIEDNHAINSCGLLKAFLCRLEAPLLHLDEGEAPNDHYKNW